MQPKGESELHLVASNDALYPASGESTYVKRADFGMRGQGG